MIWQRWVFLTGLTNLQIYLLSTRGPRAFYRSPDNQQQTVQSEKKDNQNDRIQINACVDSVYRQYISMLVWTFGLKEEFVKWEALPLPFFAPPWIHPLEYLAETTTRMAAFQVKPFVLKLSLTPSCPALDPPQGGSDKKP